MDENPTPPEKRATPMAGIMCFVALVFTYLLNRHFTKGMAVGWWELLVLLSIPVAVTFAVLYRSRWHREITGFARTCSLLALSFLIAVGEVIGIVFMYCIALFCLMAISGGNH